MSDETTAKNLSAAAVTAAARSPGLPRHLIFRSQPALARRLEGYGELWATTPQASAQQPRVAVELSFPLTVGALLRERPVFFSVLAFPLLLVPVSISELFLIFVGLLSRKTSSSPLSVWVWACGAALISMTRWARVFREALAMQRPPLRRQIFLWLLCVPCLDSAIFLESQKHPFPFAISRTLVWRVESRWRLRLAWQKLDASWPICWLPFLIWESAIFLVWEMRRLSRLIRSRRCDFFVLH